VSDLHPSTDVTPMTETRAPSSGPAEERLITIDPLADEDRILGEHFYTSRARPAREVKPKPEHYKVVCISLYNEDLEHVDALVTELKRRGHTKANRSQVIRFALAQADISKMPKGY
jgi:hypothetical protein